MNDLRHLGVVHGKVLLVHSSLSSLGFVPGGARTVISTLLEAVGPSGTLMFPTHNWFAVNQGARNYDVRSTRSCVGALSEVFRQLPGAVRSLHPTHSVAAIGPLGETLIRDHEAASTPCGEGTPYARLLQLDGDILFLGVGLEANTAFHSIEALCSLDYLLQERADLFDITSADGRSRCIEVRCHAQNIPRRFEDFSTPLMQVRALRMGSVGPAKAMLLRGTRFLEVMRRAVDKHPALLLKSNEPVPTLDE